MNSDHHVNFEDFLQASSTSGQFAQLNFWTVCTSTKEAIIFFQDILLISHFRLSLWDILVISRVSTNPVLPCLACFKIKHDGLGVVISCDWRKPLNGTSSLNCPIGPGFFLKITLRNECSQFYSIWLGWANIYRIMPLFLTFILEIQMFICSPIILIK